MSDPVTHIKRTRLPWRQDEPLSECGLDSNKYASVTRDEAVAEHKRLGAQRFAILHCMTCIQRANVQYRTSAVQDNDVLAPLDREIRRVAWRNPVDRDRLVRELEALTLLSEAHADEFNEILAAKSQTVNLAAARSKKKARSRYG